MRRRMAYRAGLSAAVLALAGLCPAHAWATSPGPGVTSTLIAEKTIGNTDYIVRRITLPPGQSTGWHYHDGTLRGVVEQGTLSHFTSRCRSDGVYRKGDVIVEQPGADHVHIGVNKGSEPVVLDVLYTLPHGDPLSEDAPNPGCSLS